MSKAELLDLHVSQSLRDIKEEYCVKRHSIQTPNNKYVMVYLITKYHQIKLHGI